MNNYIQLGKEQIAISDETAENLRKQFAEPKPEIRHGDLAIHARDGIVAIQPDDEQEVPSILLDDASGEEYSPDTCGWHEYITWLDINIFELMAEAMKGKKEYEVCGIDFKLDGDYVSINGDCGFSDRDSVAEFLEMAVSFAIQHKLAEAK